MSDVALPGSIEPAIHRGPNLDGGINPLTGIIYMGVVAAALLFVAYSIYVDVNATGTRINSYLPYLLLFVALLIALGFEFVNGFHDTANAVATVIYTRSLPANIAVVWSGMFNLFGVLLSSGAVAFGIVSLLAGRTDPAGRLRCRVCHGVRASDRGHHLERRHLVFRAAGLELAHPDRIDHGRRHHQRAVARPRRHLRGGLVAGGQYRQGAICCRRCSASRWQRCCCSSLKMVLQHATPALFAEPKGDQPPPLWIRGILILTCTLVSFFHGSNDGQKGMGLIMLILIGTVPTAYALNRALPDSQIQQFDQPIRRLRARSSTARPPATA